MNRFKHIRRHYPLYYYRKLVQKVVGWFFVTTVCLLFVMPPLAIVPAILWLFGVIILTIIWTYMIARIVAFRVKIHILLKKDDECAAGFEALLLNRFIDKNIPDEDRFELQKQKPKELKDTYHTYSSLDVERQVSNSPLSSHGKKIIQFVQPVVRLMPDFKQNIKAVGVSKWGGNPDCMHDFRWPEGTLASSGEKAPLRFLAQINLNDFQLPFRVNRKGLLSFFVNEECGLDCKMGDWWRVYHFEDISSLRRVKGPRKALKHKEAKIKFENCHELPRREPYKMKAQDIEDYEALIENFDYGSCIHKIGGNPDEIQGGVYSEWEKEIKRYGVDRPTQEQPDDWQLVLQVDSSCDLNINWVDDGKIYFGVLKDDLNVGRLDRICLAMEFY